MIDELDTTIAALLDDAEAPAELRAADVSFAGPDKDFKPAQPTVNLFLYALRENRELRATTPVYQRTNDTTYKSTPPPARVDCTYLVTAWSPKSGGLRVAEEHRLLGLCLWWLGHFPLIGPAQLPAEVARAPEDRSMGQFWSALGIVPRAAFDLTVTVALRSLDPDGEFGVVKTFEIHEELLRKDGP
ncbi:DUF4255 domain-containing protein [Actinoplanes sp. LDG1-06]|uniref:DUF4255 domain-containing protein n=1 Tax=Paractinoplanes ovalisporus TaxID=2810368 RepID=A0ABS2A2C3_9ACTN|nr:Pvc16 family protein [Actinoplanes ovalisporus]MBM2613992.1 DUF4255 domain-containing protein [Actinoplanes ovalisporus]